MKTAIIFLAVALAVFIYLFILSEISLRQEINEWAKEVAENCKLKEQLKKYEQEENTMNVNGHWYTETEAQAYIITLEHKNAALEDKHLNECRQISEYDYELRQAKRLLKAAVEDINYYVDCYEAHCDECCCDHDNHCHWKHEAEALALIGGGADD